jgi:uncharacterized BrkB/YihY/UPF0761 family membrane protein
MIASLLFLVFTLGLTLTIFERLRRHRGATPTAEVPNHVYLGILYGLPTTLVIFFVMLVLPKTSSLISMSFAGSSVVILLYVLRSVVLYEKNPTGDSRELWRMTLLWSIGMSVMLTASIAFVIFAGYLI